MEGVKPLKSTGVRFRILRRIRFKAPPRVERDEQEFCVRWGKICHGCCSCKSNPMLPKDLDDNTIVHHFKSSDFKLYGLPVPELNKVIGLVGSSVIGKSVALKILARKIRPNLGRHESPPNWQEVITYFKGSNDELYKYFTRIVADEVKVCFKPESDLFARRNIQGFVGELLDTKDERGMKADICSDLRLNQILERNVKHLSDGEFQRFAIGLVAVQKAEVYIFDQPSNYLDVKQRLKAAQVIRYLSRPDSYVMVADNDLSVLGYMSDYIICQYGLRGSCGVGGSCGVVSLPVSVREGINMFLNGFVQTRSSKESPTSKVAEASKVNAEEQGPFARYTYPSMSITRGGFKLKVNGGEFRGNQIVVLLGENGTGKSTFLQMLAGLLKPDMVELPKFRVSYKRQKIKSYVQLLLHEFLSRRINDAYQDPQFILYVLEPLGIMELIYRRVTDLVEVQLLRVALCLCLGKPADIYLIDEVSAFMSAEEIVVASKVIERFIRHTKKTAVVVDHDFMLATYLADSVVVFEGSPAIDCTASSPHPLLTGMNLFLSHMDFSCRIDKFTFLPQIINKTNSAGDLDQKSAGHYYLED